MARRQRFRPGEAVMFTAGDRLGETSEVVEQAGVTGLVRLADGTSSPPEVLRLVDHSHNDGAPIPQKPDRIMPIPVMILVAVAVIAVVVVLVTTLNEPDDYYGPDDAAITSAQLTCGFTGDPDDLSWRGDPSDVESGGFYRLVWEGQGTAVVQMGRTRAVGTACYDD